MVLCIVLSAHGFVDKWLHPNACADCLVDFRGFDLLVWLGFLGVPVVMVAAAGWLVVRYRLSAAALAMVADLWVIGVIAASAIWRGAENPDQASAPILGIQVALAVVPALATLVFSIVMLTRRQ